MKKKAEKPRREVTKRQLSRWQRQKKRQRIILGSGILIIVAVLAVVGVGVYNRWYIAEYKPLHETVIEVNDTKFDMNYYIKMLNYYGGGVPIQYMQLVADEVVKRIEENELIRQGALELGISVSDEEVDEELESYDPPLSKDYRDVVRTGLLVDRLRDEYFEQQVPMFAEQRHIMAMFLESESQANEVIARLEAGEDFAELAGELSLDATCKEKGGDLGWRPEGVLPLLFETSILDEHAFNCEVGVLSQPIYDEETTKGVGYWIAKVLERRGEEEKAKVLGILLGSEEEAQTVRDRLEAGEDFGELAEELSEHEESKEDGGNLGWLTPGEAGLTVDEFMFNPEIELGVVSEPIFDDTIVTEGGYWLIKVLERIEKKEEADVQVILLGSEKEAKEVKNRLEAGEDFDALAEELSQHDESKEEGGKVTGITPGMMSSAFSEFAFNPEVELETLSEPIRDDVVVTTGGYWLVRVEDIDDNREIGEDDRELLKGEALGNWVEALWDDPENRVESYLDDEKKQWAILHAIES